jgi:hypothetical protein
VLYLAPRTDGIPGTGTEANPIDISTAAKFDAFFATQYATHMSQASDPATFYFAAGEYTTNAAIHPLSGWSLMGETQQSTIIKLTATRNLCNNGYGTAIISTNTALNGFTVANMTLDGGTLGTGTAVMQTFATPHTSASVTIKVSSTSLFSVGQMVYVQDTSDTGGIETYYGTFTVTAVGSGQITICNNLSSAYVRPGDLMSAAAGTTVPKTAYVFVMTYCRFGLALAGQNLKVQDVTVEDVTDPVYEGPYGIDIHSPPGTCGANNYIIGSTVQIIFGCAGWGISVVYGAPYDGSNNYAQCNIENCTILGSGYSQGIDLQKVSNSTITGTLISNFASAIFSDSGPCTNNIIEGNTLVDTSGPASCGSQFALAGGSSSRWTNLTLVGNTIQQNSPYGWNVYLLSPVFNSSIRTNRLLGVGNNNIVFQGGGTGDTVSGNTTH